MTASKLSKGASDRLLNLLYATSLVEIANKTPLVTKFLHDLPPTHPEKEDMPSKSILDDLMANNWNHKPWSQVTSDIPDTPVRSNILKFSCKNNFISNDTLHNLYPIERERKYQIPANLAKNGGGPPFFTIKGRNPQDLQPMGVYYLIFRTFSLAAAYWLETQGKVVNGFDLKLSFLHLTSKDLRQMSSPHLSSLYDEQAQIPLVNQSDPLNVPQGPPLNPKQELTYPYPLLMEYSAFHARQNTVLVKNLPFGLSKHALPKVLWDYQLQQNDSIHTVISDPINQVSLTLIRFADRPNALRFVRNFHGRKWESVQTKKEKKLYEPILCEIVD